jgi:hypothetical protein
VVRVEHEVWDKMGELKKSFPPGIDYINIYDPTTFVSQSIHEVIVTIGIAILLVVGVVYLFLQSWRATIIPVVAIPVSLVGAFSILAALGISINNLSLFGLVLAVGIVVDDAIVVVENVERNMALGMSPREAAHQTMSEVSAALIAIALTLCAVFVPSAFFSGISGLFFTQFATTIAALTVISCLVSLSLSPALSAVLLKPHQAHAKPWGLNRILRGAFGRFNAGFEWMSSSYGKITSRFVRATAIILIVYVAHGLPVRADAYRLHPGSGHRLPCHGHPAAAGLQPRPHRRGGPGGERRYPENPRRRAHVSGDRVRRDDKYRFTQRGHDFFQLALAVRQTHPRRECRDDVGSRAQAPSGRQGRLRPRCQPAPGPGSRRRWRLQVDGRGPQQSWASSPRQCDECIGCGRQQGSGVRRRLHPLQRGLAFALCRHRPPEGREGRADADRRVLHPAALPRLAVRERLQLSGPHLPGPCPGR